MCDQNEDEGVYHRDGKENWNRRRNQCGSQIGNGMAECGRAEKRRRSRDDWD